MNDNNNNLSDLRDINFTFQDGDEFVQDPVRSENLKNLLQPKQKPAKLPADYQIDILEAIQDLSPQQLTEDHGVTKYVLKEGIEGDTQVHLKGIVRIKYELRLADGRLKDPQKTRGNIHRISLNSSNPMIKGLRLAFCSLSTGEVSWFRITGSYNHTTDGLEESETLFYKIEMVEHSDPKSIINNSCQEDRLKNIQDIRVLGLQSFNKQNYDQAIREYQRGINYTNTWPKLLQDTSIMRLVTASNLIYKNNLAQCYMETDQNDKALEVLNAIKSQSRNTSIEVKTLYRLAKCYYNQSQFEQALSIISDMTALCTLKSDELSDVELLRKQCKKNIEQELLIMQRKRKRVKKST